MNISAETYNEISDALAHLDNCDEPNDDHETVKAFEDAVQRHYHARCALTNRCLK
jgi:hypothetical protein